MEVIVQDANNIVIEVDQGRQGRGISTVGLVTVGADYYLLFTFTDGSTEQVGPIAPIVTEVLFAEARNAEATTILKGQPVYLFQAQGNLATVKLAYNTSDATSAKTLGLAAENIAPGAQGLITCQGTLGGLNTSAYNEGDTLYLGPTAGTLTNVKPQAPNHLVYIGVVERANAGAGQIYVRVQNGFELDEIHDVRIVSPINGNTLIYDASTSLWKNAGITAGSGINVTNGPASITVGNTGVLSFSGGTTGFTPSTATSGAVTLAGTLSTANGGTGLTSFTANRVLYTSSTSAIGQSANLTFDGTTLTANALTVTNNPTLSAGVAGGVLYLNGSKVATSAANFVFDGYTFATGLAGTGNYNTGIQLNGTNASGFGSTITGLRNSVNTWSIGDSAPIAGGANASLLFYNYGTLPWVWQLQTGGEQMRLNSTGLGIGTSSPARKLHVAELSAGSGIRISGPSGDNNWAGGIEFYSANATTIASSILVSSNGMLFNYGGSERMRLDSSGNLGLASTPSAWGNESVAIQLGFSGAIQSYKSGTTAEFMNVLSNAYNDNTNWRYIRDGAATRYEQNESVHRWFTSASGSTGATITFTTAMTLDASGNLMVSPITAPSGMPTAQTGVNVFGGSTVAASTSPGILTLGANSNSILTGEVLGRLQFYSNDASAGLIGSVAKIDCLATNNFAGSQAQTALTFHTNTGVAGSLAERMRLDSSGNLGVGTTTTQIGYSNALTKIGVLSTWDGTYNGTSLIGYGGDSNGTTTFKMGGAIGLSSSYWTGSANQIDQFTIGVKRTATGSGNHTLQFWNASLSGNYQLAEFGGNATAYAALYASGAEGMRLTSTGLGIGTSSPTAKLHVEGNTNANSIIFFKNSNPAASAFVSLSLGNDVNGLGGFKYTSSTFTGTPNALLYGGDFHVFNNIAGVERMRLDSSGNLGVGTTSPQTRLHVLAASAADVEVARFQNPFTGTGSASITIGDTGGTTYRPFTIRSNWTSGPGVVFIANRDIAGRGFDFRNNADTTSLFFIESNGNIGLGVTPSAWSTGVALQTRGAGLWDNGVNNTYLVQNAFFNGTNWIYRNSFAASQYLQIGGAHQWWTAPAGTAGNTAVFTQAMTLNASGNLGIGTTSPSNNLDVFSSAAAVTVRFGSSNSNATQILQRADASSEGKISFRTGATENWSIGLFAATSNALQFFASGAERLRISSAGNQIATQPAESAQNANATLTVANLQARIITSNAAVTLTLPTGTDLDTYATSMATNTAFECTFIATTANAITIDANGNTTVGSLTVAGNTSGTFRFRKTATNTFTVYRVA